jgi:hypothetical protein
MPKATYTAASYSYSAQHIYLELALAAQGNSLAKLEEQMDSFQPLSAEALQVEWQKLWDHYRLLNLDKTEEQLKTFVDSQIAEGRSPRMQYFSAFTESFAVHALTITVLSHALVEAIINASLVLGLHDTGKAALFTILERADVKHKWTVGPQSFLSTYELPKGSSLYRELAVLCRRRNSYAHSTISLYDDSHKVILAGSREFSFSMDEDSRNQLRRFLVLPYDLHRQLVGQVSDTSMRFRLESLVVGYKTGAPPALFPKPPVS